MGSVLLIDAAYMLKGASLSNKKYDLIKTARLLEKENGFSFNKKLFFNSSLNSEADKTAPFFNFLHRSGFDVRLYDVKDLHIDCPSCKHHFTKQVQKGVDVGVATYLCKSAFDPTCDRLVLVAGDGDLEDAAKLFVEEQGKCLITAGFSGTISGILNRLSAATVLLDDYWSEIEKVF